MKNNPTIKEIIFQKNKLYNIENIDFKITKIFNSKKNIILDFIKYLYINPKKTKLFSFLILMFFFLIFQELYKIFFIIFLFYFFEFKIFYSKFFIELIFKFFYKKSQYSYLYKMLKTKKIIEKISYIFFFRYEYQKNYFLKKIYKRKLLNLKKELLSI